MSYRILGALLAGLLLATGGFAAERRLVLDPAQSRVEVAVKATVDSFTARLPAYVTEIDVGEGGRISAARFAFQFRDLLTGKPKRDAAMHEWQDTDRHPAGEFRLAGLEVGADGRAEARGRLTLHGVTRDVAFPVTILREDNRYAIDGDVPIDVREHGLPVIRLLGLLKVDPVVRVRFHLQGSVAP
jgi:polyisoprenoid-binding protein YceI